MGRVIAFDYGSKRIGIAVTDPLRMFAQPLDTIPEKTVFDWIKQYSNLERIDTFVVGNPLQLNGKPSESAEMVYTFVRNLESQYPLIPVVMIDERMTSKMAKFALVEAGVKKQKRKNKSLLDTMSATLILQTYLDLYP